MLAGFLRGGHDARALLSGAQVAGHVLLEPLGRGGMGVTYRARCGDDVVALKVLHDASADRARFEAECRLLQDLGHPGIVRHRRSATEVFAHARTPLVLPAATRSLPAALQAILYRCLEPRRDRRYSTAGELAADLRAAAGGEPVGARRPVLWQRRLRRSRLAMGVISVVGILGLAAVVWAGEQSALPRLTVDALFDDADGKVSIDGRLTPYWLPLENLPIQAGPHHVRFESKHSHSVEREFVVVGPDTRLTLFAAPIELVPDIDLYPGADPAFLVVRSDGPGSTVTVDGNAIAAGARWIRLAPGKHVVEARDARGHHERQRVGLNAGELHETYLLPEVLAGYEGTYRRSLACIAGPLPDDCELQLSNGAIVFANDFQDHPGRDRIGTNVYVTMAEPGLEGEARLRVRFPVPMRKVTFYFHGLPRREGDHLAIDWRLGAEPWHQAPLKDEVVLLTAEAGSNTGATSLEVRARMRVAQMPTAYATLAAFAAYVDTVDGVDQEHPCFALVAQPVDGR